MKKIVLFLVVVFSVITLASCSAEEEWAVSCGDTKISKNAFQAQLVTYKTEFLLNYLGVEEDNNDYWTQTTPGGEFGTFEEALIQMTLEDMVQFAWVVEYAKRCGVEISDIDREVIEEDFTRLKKTFESEDGFEEYIKKLGLTEDDVKVYLENTLYYDEGFGRLVAQDGLYPVTDALLKGFYEENFYTVKYVYLNDETKTDEDGNTVPLTEEEIQEKHLRADGIISDLENGVSFDVLYMMTEDAAYEEYPDGMTMTPGLTTDVTLDEEILSMEIGEYKKITPESGGIYVVSRVELDDMAYYEYEEYINTAVYQAVTEDIYSDHASEVEVNEEVIQSFDVKSLPILN